jgi:hypothetical protein
LLLLDDDDFAFWSPSFLEYVLPSSTLGEDVISFIARIVLLPCLARRITPRDDCAPIGHTT